MVAESRELSAAIDDVRRAELALLAAQFFQGQVVGDQFLQCQPALGGVAALGDQGLGRIRGWGMQVMEGFTQRWTVVLPAR